VLRQLKKLKPTDMQPVQRVRGKTETFNGPRGTVRNLVLKAFREIMEGNKQLGNRNKPITAKQIGEWVMKNRPAEMKHISKHSIFNRVTTTCYALEKGRGKYPKCLKKVRKFSRKTGLPTGWIRTH
jgi:hypothetical protein